MTCKTVTSILFGAIHCYLTITAVRAFCYLPNTKQVNFWSQKPTIAHYVFDLPRTKNTLAVLCSFNHFCFCWLKQLPELELCLCEKLWVAAPDRSGQFHPWLLVLDLCYPFHILCLFYSLCIALQPHTTLQSEHRLLRLIVYRLNQWFSNVFETLP